MTASLLVSELLELKGSALIYPSGHSVGMRVPRGGASCLKCRFLKGRTRCDNPNFVSWNGGEANNGDRLPADANEYACDFFAIDHSKHGDRSGYL